MIDAAGQTWRFKVGVELVAIRYDEEVGCGFLARRDSRLGDEVNWGTGEKRELELRIPGLVGGARC